ncbi:Hint domain-containing protein [Paracoccus rhizosphaerae]|uniref:Hint domain-containing protein n=1 Tax=Paracoccus rhizosphaerae TaxID=1133347 RepID=A0ABV6CHY8_9RHOB|nr:Hint domain-containing protein [Paracoccus rhizosphaerae]
MTVLTFSDPIDSGRESPAVFVPFSDGSGPVDMSQAIRSEITLSDDGGFFDLGLYFPGEADQRLLEPATFGSGDTAVTVDAGTRLSNWLGAVMSGPVRLDADGAEVADQFVMMLPRTLEPGGLGTELGARQSVLVFPLPQEIGGRQIFPEFDQSLTYSYSKVSLIGSGYESLSYAAACFGHGTMIRTTIGLCPVEDLRVGDLVMTLDRGPRPVLWIGSRLADPLHLDLRPQDRPIGIAAGALGDGQPCRRLVVSPQHRLLIRSAIAGRMFGCPEVLVAARHLVGQPAIFVAPVTAIRYWHVLLEHHDLIDTEGAWSESLYPGPVALSAYPEGQRQQIRAALPAVAEGPPPTPRPVPAGRKARQLSARHLRNNKPLVATLEPATT